MVAKSGGKVWKQRGTGKLFSLDTDKMKKAEYGISACRMPVIVGGDEFLLYDADWTDDKVSYIIVDKKYLIEEK